MRKSSAARAGHRHHRVVCLHHCTNHLSLIRIDGQYSCRLCYFEYSPFKASSHCSRSSSK
jgi:hypothetical protein